MVIGIKNKRKIKFRMLKIGTVFWWNNTLYCKCLIDGESCAFDYAAQELCRFLDVENEVEIEEASLKIIEV